MAVRFRLARVLRLRTRLREQAEDELARVRLELERLRGEIAATRATRLATREAEEAAAARDQLTGAHLAEFRRHETAMATRETALEAASAETVTAVTAARDALLVRRREERQLERLAEHAETRAATDEAHRVDTLLDELALRGRNERR